MTSARDDYPVLAALADDGLPLIDLAAVGEFRDALDEIDHLRSRLVHHEELEESYAIARMRLGH